MKREEWLKIQKQAKDASTEGRLDDQTTVILLLTEILDQLYMLNQSILSG